jgi:hypothetical protein
MPLSMRQHDLPTASAGTSQAPSAAVDKSAPCKSNTRFAVAGLRYLGRLRYINTSLARIPCASTMALKRRPRSA